MPETPLQFVERVFGPLEDRPEGTREALVQNRGQVPGDLVPSVLATMAMARNAPNAQPIQGSYQAQLNPTLEKLFEDWVRQGNVRFDIKQMFPDYDMRRWWSLMRQHDPRATFNFDPEGQRIFFPPAFTTPYSLDFGPKSIYWKGP